VYFFSIYGKKFPKKNLLSNAIFPRLFRGGKRVIFFKPCFLELALLKSLLGEYRAIMKKCGGNDYNVLINQYNSVRNRLSGYFERGGRILALVKLLYIYI
jgi:hypothetical protein